MIKRITNVKDFFFVIDDISELFSSFDEAFGHQCGLTHSKDAVKNNFGNNMLLNHDVFVWANKTKGKYDSVCIFTRERSVRFGQEIFTQFLWLSKNANSGFKILKKAVDFARSNDFKYISMYNTKKNPNSEKYKAFCEKLGFLEDSTNFISKL